MTESGKNFRLWVLDRNVGGFYDNNQKFQTTNANLLIWVGNILQKAVNPSCAAFRTSHSATTPALARLAHRLGRPSGLSRVRAGPQCTTHALPPLQIPPAGRPRERRR